MPHTFTIGQRVSVVSYGVPLTGKVENVDRRIVWVRMDESGLRRWYYPESLTAIKAPADPRAVFQTASLLKVEPMSEQKTSGTIGWQFATYKHDKCAREVTRTVAPIARRAASREDIPEHITVLCAACRGEA